LTSQIVIRFSASSLDDFDRLVALEDPLIAKFKGNHDVDGHDFGQGEFNIFILTQNPENLVEELLNDTSLRITELALSISQRGLKSEDIQIVWSNALSEM